MENVVIEFDHIVIGEFIDGLEDNFFNPQYTYELMPADVFALGVALFAFILQKLPFEYAT